MSISVNPVSFKNRPQTIIWVGEGKTQTTYRDGSVTYPFLTIQEAVDWAALQTESSFHVYVSPGTYGDLDVPPDKAFVFESSSVFYGAIIGDLTVTASPGQNNLVQFKNFAINNIDYLGTPGDTVVLAVAYTGLIGGNVTNSGGVNAILISAGIIEPGSSFTGCTIVGTVDIGATGQFSAANSDVQSAVAAGSLNFEDCHAPLSINCYGDSIEMSETDFQAGTPTITFLAAAGTVNLDNFSAIRFGLAGGNIVNGDPFQDVPGPHLLRTDVDLNALDAVVPTTAYNITSSADLDDKDVSGIVYPSTTAGKLGLVWQSGQRIPSVGLPADIYYRNKVTGGYTATPTTQQIGNGDGNDFYVNIQPTPREQIVLSMLNPSGVWFPSEYAGPTAASTSSPILNVGFARIPKDGVLTNFKLTQASFSGSTITNLQVYVAPVGIPSLFAFSGLSLGVVAGDYISTDNTSQLSVIEDDIIAIYNAEFFGWAPNALTITADLLLN